MVGYRMVKRPVSVEKNIGGFFIFVLFPLLASVPNWNASVYVRTVQYSNNPNSYRKASSPAITDSYVYPLVSSS